MQIDQVSDSVYAVAGTNVNWALVTDGSGVTVIDAGYPADANSVLESVRQIGHRVDDVAAVLLTHAHLDHMGAIPTLVSRFGVPVYTGAEEVRHARREYVQQVSPVDMVKQLATRRGRRWVPTTIMAVRGQLRLKLPTTTAVDDDTLAALPGGLSAIATPGHTDGHTAYYMPSERVLFSGDALVTGHPLVRETGPQLLPTFFTHDEARARDSFRILADKAPVTLVPGHGRPTELSSDLPLPHD